MWKRCWNAVVAVAKRIGQVQAWLILSAFYFVLMAPVALFFKLTSDPLRLRRARGSAWFARSQSRDGLEWAKNQ